MSPVKTRSASIRPSKASPAQLGSASTLSDDAGLANGAPSATTLKRLGQFLSPYTGLVTNTIICLLVLCATRLALPLPMKLLIDEVFPSGNTTLLWVVAGGLLLVVMLRMLFDFLSRFTVRYIGQRLVFDLRLRLFRHLQRLSMSFYDERSTGKILSRLTGDVAAFHRLMTGQAFGLFTNAFMFVAVLAIMLSISWRLTLVAFAVFPLHVLTCLIFHGRAKSTSKAWCKKQAAITGYATETLPNAKVVKPFTAENRESLTFARETQDAFGMNLNMGLLSMQWDTASNGFHFLGKLIVLVFGGQAVIQGSLKPGTFIAFYLYTNMLYQPVMQLVELITQVAPALTGVERVFEMLDTQPDVAEAAEPMELGRIEGRVELRRVGFAYPNGEQVLHDLSCSAEPGQVVALVGPSGSGKSAVANLIARFCDATSGQVLIDGHDIESLRLNALRDQIGIVSQEALLFSGSIEENIRYGKPDATREEIVQAARGANAHEFVEELPDGYASEVGENGVDLSGSQRQRIAIARAILRNPRILILDEAASALDTASEQQVQRALEHLMEGRTTFVIAHRLPTIKSADSILVLQDGRIVQRGRHDELLAQPGLYRQLYMPQEQADRPEPKPKRRVA